MEDARGGLAEEAGAEEKVVAVDGFMVGGGASFWLWLGGRPEFGQAVSSIAVDVSSRPDIGGRVRYG